MRFHRMGRYRGISREPEKSNLAMLKSTMRLFSYLKPHWWKVGGLLALTAGTTALGLVMPWLLKMLIDDVISHRDSGLLLIITFVAVACLVGRTVFGFLHSYLSHQVGQQVVRKLRNELYEHIQSLGVHFFENRPTGEIMSRIVNDSGTVEFMIVHTAEALVTSILTLIAVGVVVFLMNVRLAALILIPIPFIVLTIVYFSPRLKRQFTTFREKVADLNAFLQDRISGIRVVKAFTREADEQNGFEAKTGDYYNSFMRAALSFSIFRPMIGFFSSIGRLIVIFFGGLLAIKGQLSAGEIAAFMLYVGFFYQPVGELGRILGHDLPRCLASADRLFELLNETGRLEVAPDAVAPSAIQGRIEIRDLSFSYGEEKVLQDINLTIEPGETIALVGPSGVGKSTLVDLLCRFYDPDCGQILVDGIDIRRLDPEVLRRSIGIVLQEPFLFNTTIEENIAYARSGCTQEEIRRAAALAGADQFISELPRGYQTQVGERGVKLSVGQKQRISIARALLKDPPILVLDEATSSVDTPTEKAIQKAIEVVARNRTTIIIAHRLSTAAIADRIVVLEDGRIVEEGTQQELLSFDGRFSRLYHMQRLPEDGTGQ